MSHNELLERAIKAAGYWCEFEPDSGIGYDRFLLITTGRQGGIYKTEWHPLTDEGDRYRLARATKLVIDFENGIVHTPRSADGVMGHYGFDADTEALVIIEAAASTINTSSTTKIK